MRILFAGGGTAGHLMPILSIVSELKEVAKDKKIPLEFLLITTNDGFGVRLAEEANISYKTIFFGKIRRYWSWKNIIDIFKMPIGFIQAFWQVYAFMPDIIFGKGGYASAPTVIAGWICRIPIIIHESDATPGLANRFLSHFARRIALGFPSAGKKFSEEKVILTGNPIRKEILKGDKERAKLVFSLEENLPVILIIGGSQGSQIINETILETLFSLLENYQIIHQCGIKNYEEMRKKVEELNVHRLNRFHLYPFLKENLKDAYAAADLIISRAGATAVAEIITVGKPSILIPLSSSAGNHQAKNAYYYSKFGAAIRMSEKNFKPRLLIRKVEEIFAKPHLRREMTLRARKLATPNTARKIAEEILKLG
jgi:UDP-N-acetylglucosamine--N-acetylmuramyl-(pentapeptide) pyrophosphoryl-undecaprenol N-acetylglucosamine transferase